MITRTFLVFMICSTIVTNIQAETVFTGLPEVKISESGDSRLPEAVSRDKAKSFVCVISKIDGKYHWTSRENARLFRVESGAFITYVAENGSGYVRITNPELKQAADLAGGPEAKFDYVEHLLFGLRSITYYGKAN